MLSLGLFLRKSWWRMASIWLVHFAASLLLAVAAACGADPDPPPDKAAKSLSAAFLEAVEAINHPNIEVATAPSKPSHVYSLTQEYVVWQDSRRLAESIEARKWLANLKGSTDVEIRLKARLDGLESWLRLDAGDPPKVARLSGLDIADAGNGVVLVRWRRCERGHADKIVSDLASRAGVRGVMIDVRGNSGGHLFEAVRLVECWVPPGTELVRLYRSAVDRRKGVPLLTFTTRAQRRWQLPVVCITDGDTASTAEALVAMLKSHARGASIGRTTCGDGIAYVLSGTSAGEETKQTPTLIEVTGVPLYHRRGIEPDREILAPAVEHNTQGGGFGERCRASALAIIQDGVAGGAPRQEENSHAR
jgi:hypothetical protein